jgi:hypothetical protein
MQCLLHVNTLSRLRRPCADDGFPTVSRPKGPPVPFNRGLVEFALSRQLTAFKTSFSSNLPGGRIATTDAGAVNTEEWIVINVASIQRTTANLRRTQRTGRLVIEVRSCTVLEIRFNVRLIGPL